MSRVFLVNQSADGLFSPFPSTELGLNPSPVLNV